MKVIERVLECLDNARWVIIAPIVDFYRTLRCWLRNNMNMQHFKVVKEAFSGYPFDYAYILRLEREKLQEMKEYFSNATFIAQDNYDRYVRKISLCIRLLDIILEEDIEVPYVNVKNWERFLPEYKDENISHLSTQEEKKEWRDMMLKKYPFALRIGKARYLYYKMRYEYTEDWWD